MNEEKFTLDEAFDILYSESLTEEISDNITELENENNYNTQCFTEALDILNEWNPTDLYPPAATENHDHNKDAYKDTNEHKEDDTKNVHEKEKNGLPSLQQPAINIGSYNIPAYTGASSFDSETYKPVPGVAISTKISDMKFPQNVIAFIGSLITWIKNNVLNLIDKISNIFRAMLGLDPGKSKIRPEDLAFKSSQVKNIETKYSAYTSDPDVYKKSNDMNDKLDAIFNPDHKSRMIPQNRVISQMIIPANSVSESLDLIDGTKILCEDFTDPGSSYKAANRDGGTINAVDIDISKDLIALEQSLDHFFDLFDNAFGSNNEKLFSTDDLQVILDMFKKSWKIIQHPSDSPVYSVNGSLTKNIVSADKVRSNLINTKINTDNLKSAYVRTSDQINVIAKIIAQKNLLLSNNMGVQYALLSASSYDTMSSIMATIEKRLKDGSKMEKDLISMKKAYEKLINELEARRRALMTITNVSAYQSSVEKDLNDLYVSSKYMAQIVQLRLNALALYLNELNDAYAIIKNLNSVNIVNMHDNDHKHNIFKKFKQLFKH